MKTFEVTVAVDVPAYATVRIQARTQKEANAKVSRKIGGGDPRASSIWQGHVFEPMWGEADGFRVVGV